MVVSQMLSLSAERLRESVGQLLRTNEHPFSSRVLSLAGGTAAGQLIVLLVAPVVTRLYTPYDMGLFSLYMAFMGFVGVGTGLRYETAVVSADNDWEARLLTQASILSSIPVAAVCGLVLLGMIKFDLVSYGTLPFWSAPSAVFLLIITQFFLSLRYWCVRRSEFSVISKVLAVQGVGRAFAPLIAGVIGVGWVGLLLGEAAGRMLGINRMLAHTWSSLPAITRGMPACRSLFRICRKYWKFPVIVLPSSLVDALAAAIPFPIITRLFGSEQAGLFFLVTRLEMLPASFIGASVSDVFHAHVADNYRAGITGLRDVVINTAKRMLTVGALIYAPTAFLSPLLFGAVFGKTWASAGIVMTILAPLALASLVVSPLSRVLFVADRQEVKLIIDVLFLFLPPLSLVAGRQFHWSFELTLVVYSLVSVVLYCLYFAIIVSVMGAPTSRKLT